MPNPFYDWRKPARPCMWSKDYYKQTHVAAILQAIDNYNDGLLTTLEFVSYCDYQYHKGYRLGLEDQHYGLPAVVQS